MPPRLLLVAIILLAGCAAGPSNPRLAATTAPTTRAFGKPPPDPARYQTDIDKFTEADTRNQPRDDSMLFVGSSSIRGWKLEQWFPAQPVINRGFGGSHASDVAHFVPRIVWPYKPRLVVFYAGENDISAGASAEQVFAAVRQFVYLTRQKQPGVPIVLIGIKPSPLRWDHRLEFRKANRLVQTWAKRQHAITFIDVEPAMLDADGIVRGELFKSDRLHMNDAGYAIWTTLLTPTLQRPAATKAQ